MNKVSLSLLVGVGLFASGASYASWNQEPDFKDPAFRTRFKNMQDASQRRHDAEVDRMRREEAARVAEERARRQREQQQEKSNRAAEVERMRQAETIRVAEDKAHREAKRQAEILEQERIAREAAELQRQQEEQLRRQREEQIRAQRAARAPKDYYWYQAPQEKKNETEHKQYLYN